MNAFITDAKFQISKAGNIVSIHDGTDESIQDAIVAYAIGVEKLLKGILQDINPLLVYEKLEFEDICIVLCKDRLLESHREKYSKKELRFHSCVKTVDMASAFSKTVEGNKGMLYQLLDYRAIIAHKPMDGFPYPKAWKLIRKHRYDFVEKLLAEFTLGDTSEYFKGHDGNILKLEGKELIRRDALEERAGKIETACKRAYAKIKDNPEKLRAARQEASKAVHSHKKGDIVQCTLMECPICRDVAYAEYLEEMNAGTNTGTRQIFGMKCFCCGLEIVDYELIDHFKLYNELFGKGYDFYL